MDKIDKAMALVMEAGFEPAFIQEGQSRVVICAYPTLASDDVTVFSYMGGDKLRAVFTSPSQNSAACIAVADFWASR